MVNSESASDDQMECMEILLAEMRRGEWLSNRLTLVRSGAWWSRILFPDSHLEMLTPVDQPLDKLEDLKPDEMWVYRDMYVDCSDRLPSPPATTWKVRIPLLF